MFVRAHTLTFYNGNYKVYSVKVKIKECGGCFGFKNNI